MDYYIDLLETKVTIGGLYQPYLLTMQSIMPELGTGVAQALSMLYIRVLANPPYQK